MRNWEIERTNYKVSDFLSWQRSGTLELSPSFQRRPVWKRPAKSFFIDTVVRGLPIPIVFLREQPSDLQTLEPRREVVDGQQRIRTLISYIAPALLADYDPVRDDFTVLRTHNRDLAGKPFPELPPDYRQRIIDYQFSVHIFPADTDDRDILQIFARMNSTGVKLNDQELRNAAYFGEFKTLAYELGSEQLPRWRSWSIFTEDAIARMEEVEVTSELMLLILGGLGARSKTAIDRAYTDYDEEFDHGEEVARRFRTIMDYIDSALGADLAISPLRRRALFYSLFAAFYDKAFGLGSSLTRRRPTKPDTPWISWVREAGDLIAYRDAPEDVLAATSRRTTHISSRRLVYEYLLGS
jgi:hypothetical protein